MKQLPNCITVLRMLCAVPLLIIKPFSTVFFILYVLCGISDVLDGYTARKMKTVSRTGQILDSTADVIFFVIVAIVYVRTLRPSRFFIIWLIAICLLRTASLVAGLLRFREFVFLHTYANKAAGFTLFCFPFLYIVSPAAAFITVCGIASLSAAEEFIINLTSKTPDRDIKGIFKK
jgi:CDP-diacylglycerol--glycerol-3-phosphate 3-phosphatidyltransferase